jgi:4'-phosphopantetheinyl transferase
MIPGQVIVHLIVPGAISQEMAIPCLTPDEMERACRFRFAKDAMHWRSCRAQLRMILARETGLAPNEAPLVLSEFGKPLLAPPCSGLHFNLTHSHELALIALSLDGPVGIDLEKKCRGTELLGCESTFCHPLEITNLPGDPQFRAIQLLRIWTHKEALLKALGKGLSHPPEQVRIRFDSLVDQAISAIPLPGIEDQRLQTLSHPMLADYQAVVSMPSAAKSLKINPFDSVEL